jgi:flagellar biosynthesis/type III secretory pathway M-ring protein FliF/YscJ
MDVTHAQFVLPFIHFAPGAIEPPNEMVDHYGPPFLGWLALAWLAAFVGILAFTSVYEARSPRSRSPASRSLQLLGPNLIHSLATFTPDRRIAGRSTETYRCPITSSLR